MKLKILNIFSPANATDINFEGSSNLGVFMHQSLNLLSSIPVRYPGQHVGEKALTYHNYRFRNKVFCAYGPQLIKMQGNKQTYQLITDMLPRVLQLILQ